MTYEAITADVNQLQTDEPSILPRTTSISGTVLEYFIAKKFGTRKMCARELGYTIPQVRTALIYLERRGNVRKFISRSGRPRGIYVLVGYNDDFSQEAKYRRYEALIAAVEGHRSKVAASQREYPAQLCDTEPDDTNLYERLGHVHEQVATFADGEKEARAVLEALSRRPALDELV